MEIDCIMVVNAIRGEGQMLSRFGLLIAECRDLLVELNFVEVNFIKGSANRVAHFVARNRMCAYGVEQSLSQLCQLS